MKLSKEAKLLRIFIGEDDKHDGRLLYELIVEEARRFGLAGATAYRGILGFGAHSRIHSNKILRLSQGLPMVVEIVDSKEKIEDFLPWLDTVMTEGLITMEKAQVIAYRHNDGG
jgi:uncharacterized protein